MKIQTQQPIRLTVSSASRLFGVSDKTIRRAIAHKEIRYVVVRNRYQINFESLLSWSQNKPAITKKRDESGIGRWVKQWKIGNALYSPNPPTE
jgi:excisionase family DNA binding protein